ncbi:MAG: DedA family protein [Proteobacteria bacterium]|nr:DedA family protein [Pseudomonadota bacterium]MBU1138449.1 DedA family protein [Pseudomonadota bacterium]MBU1232696.1 DedA family protein [Pseudomonadota bacterium]MBU1418849.1 DedA family protein [Pseudomonadota bacterium]MBU1455727.1 DedA family protein [Pseudomonadota bacterium]
MGETKKKKGLIRRLYDWMLHWADSRYGLPALIVLSFAESSFFPIPPDVLLIALVLGASSRWYKYAFWCTLASVAGGLAGYGIGVFAWETMGRWIIENVAHMSLVEVDGRLDIALPSYLISSLGSTLGGQYLFQVYDHWNAWIVFVFGLTPLPYKLTTITAGVARVNLPVFLLASLVARACRFFFVAWLLHKWGEPAKRFIDRYFNFLCVVFILLLAGGFALLKLFFR